MGPAKDHRRFGFFMIDNRLIEEHFHKLGVYGYAVYSAILCRMDRDRKTFPSYKWLTKTLRIGRRTVARSIATLVELELVVIEHRAGKPSIYHVTELQRSRKRESEDGSYVQLQNTEQKAIGVNPCLRGTTSGSRQAPPQFLSGTTPSVVHVGVYQDPTSTPKAGVDGGVENPLADCPKIALLRRHGVHQGVARALAARISMPQLECIVAFWLGRAGGTKPTGPGLLRRICEDPEEFGIELTIDGWKHPPLLADRKTASSPPAKPAKTRAEMEAETLALRKAAAEQAEKAKSAKGVLFRDLVGPYNGRR